MGTRVIIKFGVPYVLFMFCIITGSPTGVCSTLCSGYVLFTVTWDCYLRGPINRYPPCTSSTFPSSRTKGTRMGRSRRDPSSVGRDWCRWRPGKGVESDRDQEGNKESGIPIIVEGPQQSETRGKERTRVWGQIRRQSSGKEFKVGGHGNPHLRQRRTLRLPTSLWMLQRPSPNEVNNHF